MERFLKRGKYQLQLKMFDIFPVLPPALIIGVIVLCWLHFNRIPDSIIREMPILGNIETFIRLCWKILKKKSCFYLMAQENIISNEQIYKWMIYIVRAAVAIFANPRTYMIIKIKTTFQLPVYCKVPIASWECWVYM